MRKSKTYIYGKHAVSEGLENRPDVFRSIMFDSASDTKQMFYAYAKKLGLQISSYDRKHLPKGVSKEAVHQGVIAEIDPQALTQNYQSFITGLKITNRTGLLLLGEVTDPQNVGAMIRSAAAFGISGILIPEHNQAQISATIVKISAGMAFRVPLVSIGNVNTTLKDLKEKGFWIYGLEGTSKQRITEEKFDAPTTIIIGNEEQGIREKTKEMCDGLLSIPMHPQCESLNAAMSASIAMYQWSINSRKNK